MSDNAEYEWLLKVYVEATLGHLKKLILDCLANFTDEAKHFNLFYCSQNQLDVVKISTTLEGYRITSSDINIKLGSKLPMQTIKTCIRETASNPFCWRLHQIQDTVNNLNNAMSLLTSSRLGPGRKFDFQSGDEVLQLMDEVINSLKKSRFSLLIPKKRTIEELQHSQNMQSISPALPLDYSISFYIQAPNLVCSVYHLSQNQIRAEYQAEQSLAFLSNILAGLSLALQTCQGLKDKFLQVSNL